jgi:hypothetical protein
VRYGTNTSNPNYVSDWWLPDIVSYAAGQSVAGGDFDLANIPLVSPADDYSSRLPITFQWTKRGVGGDTYRFLFFAPNTANAWSSVDLGSASSFTMTSLPSGASTGTLYGWYVRAHQGEESYGDSFEARAFTALAGSPADGAPEDWERLEPERRGTR